MQLNLPKQYPFMGGVEPGFAPSADHAFFWSAWIKDGPRGGGQYVFRQANATAQATEVNYGPLMTGRGHLCLGADGILYITGSDGAIAQSYVIPGYVRFTSAGPSPVPIAVIQATNDADARRLAAEAKSLAQSAMTKASKATPSTVTDEHIASLAIMTIQDQLKNPQSFIASWIWQKCLDAAFGLLKDHKLVK